MRSSAIACATPLLLLCASAPALAPLCASASAQRLSIERIGELLDAEGRVDLQGSDVRVMKADYPFHERNVEAIAFRPLAEDTFPGLLLVPGYGKTARDYLPLGIRFAGAGFACIAVTQPGFGGSEGEPDFVGPETIGALEEGIRLFRAEPFVDAGRFAVFGYSRGAMAASLLATRPNTLAAAVFGAGIYDLKRAYDELTLEGIKSNIAAETGLTDEAFAERSSIFAMSRLSCPVLILHGERDENAPLVQALALRDTLEALGKEYEIEIVPDAAHNIGMQAMLDVVLPFLEKRLHPPQRGE